MVKVEGKGHQAKNKIYGIFDAAVCEAMMHEIDWKLMATVKYCFS